MEIISLIVAIVAFVFSAITYLVHDRRLKKQEGLLNTYQLQKYEEEKVDLQKAVIRANVIRGDKGRITIKVFNAGKAVAKNIHLKFIGDQEIMIGSNPFPFEFLNPQEGTEMNLFSYVGSPDKLLIELRWDDEFQEQNTHQQMLTL
ncbi:hypothetical protein [Pedobacter cryotolerans]|uniref:Uncharacterized protein n=1 Tax=Pedobacter cryotolerans TaxID=2571270 RepID=A0A4U1C8I5_9SPHI|nr:hypothetical protein [Pedobacter cryotolerans]TKC02636.1 hypothetical protein FA045_05005 [Pedobacter cryotolerans]